MATQKTIALFGAGTGLGASLAARFGREGYRVALIARRAAALDERVRELAKAGIEAVAFPADLTDLAGIPALVRFIEARFGAIDVAVYAPVPSSVGMVPAVDLDASMLQSLIGIYTYAPVEVAHEVVKAQLTRGDGAIVVVSGMAAVATIPGMSGVGPVMAATRNYLHTLNAEVAARGVYAGTVNIGAMIERSTGLRVATAGGRELAPNLPFIDPDVIAEEIWSLVTKRDRVEANLPAIPDNNHWSAK